jgi:hypothetical protein
MTGAVEENQAGIRRMSGFAVRKNPRIRVAKRVVSKDGQVMTITMSGTNEKGEKVQNVSVHDKQLEVSDAGTGSWPKHPSWKRRRSKHPSFDYEFYNSSKTREQPDCTGIS